VDFLVEFWRYLIVRKKFWMLPLLIVLALAGGLLLAAQGSVFAPFIYTLF
jgi:hypothetical protein